MSLLARVGVLMTREAGAAWRGGGGAAPAAAFFLGASALAAFSIGVEPSVLSLAGPGALMLAFAVAAILGFEHMFQEDVETGALEQLALSPTPLTALAAVKILARAAVSLGPAALISPLAAVMLGASDAMAGAAPGVLLLAAPGLVGAGAVASSLAAGRARGGMLIAVISPPLLAPTMIFAAGALNALQTGQSPLSALALLAASSIIFWLVGAVGAAAALRMHLD